jgi:hypothetical protein
VIASGVSVGDTNVSCTGKSRVAVLGRWQRVGVERQPHGGSSPSIAAMTSSALFHLTQDIRQILVERPYLH